MFLSEACSEEDSDDLVDAERFRRLSTGNTTDPSTPVRAAKVVSGPSPASYMSQKSPYCFGTLAALAGGVGATAVGAYLWHKG